MAASAGRAEPGTVTPVVTRTSPHSRVPACDGVSVRFTYVNVHTHTHAHVCLYISVWRSAKARIFSSRQRRAPGTAWPAAPLRGHPLPPGTRLA